MYVDVGQVRLRWTVAFDDYPGRDARDGGGNASQLSLGLSPSVFSTPPSLPFLSRSTRTDASACVFVRVFSQNHEYVCMLAWPRQTLSYKPTVAQGKYAHTLANKMQVGKWGREVGGDEAVG